MVGLPQSELTRPLLYRRFKSPYNTLASCAATWTYERIAADVGAPVEDDGVGE